MEISIPDKFSSSEYKSIQYEYAYPENVQYNFWNLARNHTILNAIKKENISQLNFLEIGCGNGIVVEYLRKKNINCSGVEIAEVNVLNSVKDYVFTSTDAKNLDIQFRNSINVLMFLDVLEHSKSSFIFK